MMTPFACCLSFDKIQQAQTPGLKNNSLKGKLLHTSPRRGIIDFHQKEGYMKGLFRGFLVVCLIAFLAAPVLGGESSSKQLEKQMDKLMQQVKDMDAAMKAQKDEIEALQKKIKDIKGMEAAPAAAAQDVKVTSKYDIKVYGKLKFDTIYDTNNMGRDEFITYLPANADGQDKTTFNIRDTRFGVAVTGPSLNGWASRGRFESDFYGTDSTSVGDLRIRLAYIDFEKGGTLFRVGQDWNQIASLNPNTIDFAIMGYNGNLWNRVPQVTVHQDLGGGLKGLITTYRYRWSDDDNAQIHMPWIGAKLAYSTPFMGSQQKAYIALGAAVRDGEAAGNDVTPYLTALELKVPFPFVEISGEAYMGQGLGGEYFNKGGTFNADGNAILTRGGWIQASAKPIKTVQLNLGYGLNDPKNADVGSSFYQKSQYTFGNIQVKVMEDITAGVEVAHVQTDWATGDQHGTRYQGSIWYNW